MQVGGPFTIFHVEGEGKNIGVKELNGFKEVNPNNCTQLSRVKRMKLIRSSQRTRTKYVGLRDETIAVK